MGPVAVVDDLPGQQVQDQRGASPEHDRDAFIRMLRLVTQGAPGCAPQGTPAVSPDAARQQALVLALRGRQ